MLLRVATPYTASVLPRMPVATHARTLDLEGYGPKKRALRPRNEARRTGRGEANVWVATMARFGVANGGKRPRGPRLEGTRRPIFFFFYKRKIDPGGAAPRVSTFLSPFYDFLKIFSRERLDVAPRNFFTL